MARFGFLKYLSGYRADDPFMPEMLQYCGKRFRIYKSAHKTCDTVQNYKIRRITNAVHLEGLRCDGAAHDRCQAGCLLFWKKARLKPVRGPETRPVTDNGANLAEGDFGREPGGRHCNLEMLHRATRANVAIAS